MPKTKSKNYNRYTLEFKLQAVSLAALPDVKSKDIAAALGIHPIMLYRWSMEHRNGCLTEAKYMSKPNDSPKRINPPKDDKSLAEKEAELLAANRRIKQLERQLANRDDEVDILKKARRFFEQNQ